MNDARVCANSGKLAIVAEDTMSTSPESRALGMDRKIARRDFLNGVAMAIPAALHAASGNAAQAQPGANSGNYPPLRSGLRGNYPEAVEEFGRIQSAEYAQ